MYTHYKIVYARGINLVDLVTPFIADTPSFSLIKPTLLIMLFHVFSVTESTMCIHNIIMGVHV